MDTQKRTKRKRQHRPQHIQIDPKKTTKKTISSSNIHKTPLQHPKTFFSMEKNYNTKFNT